MIHPPEISTPSPTHHLLHPSLIWKLRRQCRPSLAYPLRYPNVSNAQTIDVTSRAGYQEPRRPRSPVQNQVLLVTPTQAGVPCAGGAASSGRLNQRREERNRQPRSHSVLLCWPGDGALGELGWPHASNELAALRFW